MHPKLKNVLQHRIGLMLVDVLYRFLSHLIHLSRKVTPHVSPRIASLQKVMAMEGFSGQTSRIMLRTWWEVRNKVQILRI